MQTIKRVLAISFFIFLLAPSKMNAQNTVMDHATGLQFGYARFGYNQLEFGLNHYWSYVKNARYNTPAVVWSHTFGPFVSASFLFKDGSGLYIGPKVGFNYSVPSVLSFRISPSIEYVPHHEWYGGCDVGGSLLGLFLYYGYYVSLGSTELPFYNNHRFGIRIILNEAPFNTSGAFI